MEQQTQGGLSRGCVLCVRERDAPAGLLASQKGGGRSPSGPPPAPARERDSLAARQDPTRPAAPHAPRARSLTPRWQAPALPVPSLLSSRTRARGVAPSPRQGGGAGGGGLRRPPTPRPRPCPPAPRALSLALWQGGWVPHGGAMCYTHPSRSRDVISRLAGRQERGCFLAPATSASPPRPVAAPLGAPRAAKRPSRLAPPPSPPLPPRPRPAPGSLIPIPRVPE